MLRSSPPIVFAYLCLKPSHLPPFKVLRTSSSFLTFPVTHRTSMPSSKTTFVSDVSPRIKLQGNHNSCQFHGKGKVPTLIVTFRSTNPLRRGRGTSQTNPVSSRSNSLGSPRTGPTFTLSQKLLTASIIPGGVVTLTSRPTRKYHKRSDNNHPKTPIITTSSPSVP